MQHAGDAESTQTKGNMLQRETASSPEDQTLTKLHILDSGHQNWKFGSLIEEHGQLLIHAEVIMQVGVHENSSAYQ